MEIAAFPDSSGPNRDQGTKSMSTHSMSMTKGNKCIPFLSDSL